MLFCGRMVRYLSSLVSIFTMVNNLNRYPYPLLTHLSTWKKLFLSIIVAMSMAGSTVVLRWAYELIHGVEEFQGDADNRTKRD